MDNLSDGSLLSSTELWITIGIILVLLFLSGVFSGSETALTAASKARIHKLAKDGDRKAKRVARLIEDRERLIGAILLGNNLINILATSLATGLFLTLFGDEGIFYATLVMTFLVLVFAEVLPKSYAIANPDQMALNVARFIAFIVSIFAPLISLVQAIVRLTLRLFSIDISNIDDALSPHEEIRGAIDLQRAEGGLIKADQDMLGSILDLDAVTIEDVMVHRKSMEAIDLALPTDEIVTAVVKSPYSRIPVFDGDIENIVGILHAKDLLRAMIRVGGNTNRLNIRRIMTKPWFVPETTKIREQMDAFLDRKAHFALVVDEYGAIQGVVTLEDILEEIVGDIADEHDSELSGVKGGKEGVVQVEGTVTIRDLNRRFDWSLPDDEATTIAGLVIHEAETIPIVGQKFIFHGYEFEICQRKRNQITALKVRQIK